jgi:hypothetical protein
MGFTIAGARRFWRSRSWPTTTGTITGERITSDDSLAGYPILAYTADGKSFEVQSDAADNIYRYRRGRTFPVRYNPSNPQQMVLDKFAQNGLIWVAMGVPFFVLGSFGIVKFVQTLLGA